MPKKNTDPASLVEVYTDNDGAERAVREWRDCNLVRRVRRFTRHVRAGGSYATVYVVCVWWVTW